MKNSPKHSPDNFPKKEQNIRRKRYSLRLKSNSQPSQITSNNSKKTRNGSTSVYSPIKHQKMQQIRSYQRMRSPRQALTKKCRLNWQAEPESLNSWAKTTPKTFQTTASRISLKVALVIYPQKSLLLQLSKMIKDWIYRPKAFYLAHKMPMSIS